MFPNSYMARLTVVVSLLAMLASVPLASAQSDTFRGTYTYAVDPLRYSYTATDDLWEWRTTGQRTRVESRGVTSTMKFPETDPPGEISPPINEAVLQQEMDFVLRWYVPDLDSDSSGMAISGSTGGRLAWFVPDVGDEVIVGALNWSAKIAGEGVCKDGECAITWEAVGPLRSDGGRKCGEMSLSAASAVIPGDRVWEFKSVSGMDDDQEIVEFWTASISFDQTRDGSSCFIGETEKNVRTGDVSFFYSDDRGVETEPFSLGEPDRPHVMPGDNVRIDYYLASNLPLNLLESLEVGGDTLWDPASNPLPVVQDMQIGLRYHEGRNSAELGGEVRSVFPSGLVAVGSISGSAVCDESGENCTIGVVQQLDILEQRGSGRCGVMTLAMTVAVDYANDAGPILTLNRDGVGSITLRDHPKCFLD